jgi:hypothetical protein
MITMFNVRGEMYVVNLEGILYHIVRNGSDKPYDWVWEIVTEL